MITTSLWNQDAGIHVGQVMQFACTLELSAPKDLAKMYNFVSTIIIIASNNNINKMMINIISSPTTTNKIMVSCNHHNQNGLQRMKSSLFQNKVKSNLPRDDINLQFCRGVLKDKRAMLEEMKVTQWWFSVGKHLVGAFDVDAFLNADVGGANTPSVFQPIESDAI